MSVVANRSGNIATITITIDVSDIIAAAGVSNAVKKTQGLQRAADEMNRAVEASRLTDEQIDEQTAILTAQALATKSARATGTL